MSALAKEDCEIGKVGETSQLKEIEWKIDNFVIQKTNFYCFTSPSFSIANVLWTLRLWPHWNDSIKFIELGLLSNYERNYPVEYRFGLKKVDGSTQPLTGGIVKGCSSFGNCLNLIEKTELLKRKSELMPCDVLIVTCTLKFMTEFTDSIQTSVLDKTKPQKLISLNKPLKNFRDLDKLSKNFRDLFGDEDTCDTTLKIKDKEYKAHRSVLIARSSIFAANFKHDTLERQTGVIIIPDCDPNSFEEFLKYLYCGQLEECSYDTAINLYYTSDKYDVQELKAFCIKYLLQSLTVENVCEVASFADKYDETQLVTGVQDFFNRNVDKVFETAGWESLMKKDYRLANSLLKGMSKEKFKE